MKRRRWQPWALSLGILLSIGLAFVSPRVPEARADSDASANESAADAYKIKMRRLSAALSGGQRQQQVLSEQEINSHLNDLMARRIETEAPSALTLTLEDASVDLSTGRMTVFLEGRLAKVPVVFRVRFADCTDYGPLPRRSIWVGYLPLVGPFGQFMAGRMKPLLSPLRTERNVVSQLETCKIEDESIQLTVAAAQ